MSWVQKGMIVGLVGLGALTVMRKVGGSASAGLDPQKSPLRTATYASAIPIIPGAAYEDEMGGNFYDEIGGPVTFTSHAWFFTLAGSAQETIDFYAKNLPPGSHRVEAEPGTTAFEWRPPGTAQGEHVSVRISEGKLQIGESVKVKAVR